MQVNLHVRFGGGQGEKQVKLLAPCLPYWLAPHVVRLAHFLSEKGERVAVTFIDPDTVELKNTFRQNFGLADVGTKKAETLALRYGPTWETTIHVHTSRFDPKMIDLDYGDVGVVLGCVDNAAARRSIADAFKSGVYAWQGSQEPPLPRRWWLDCGNGENTGQVLLGCALSAKELKGAFPCYPNATYCVNLPSPIVQHPDLLEPQADEICVPEEKPGVACAEMAWSGDQSPSINAMVANIAATYLWRMFADKKALTMYATYCNLSSMNSRSTYITPSAVAQVVGKAETWFH